MSRALEAQVCPVCGEEFHSFERKPYCTELCELKVDPGKEVQAILNFQDAALELITRWGWDALDLKRAVVMLSREHWVETNG